MGTKDERRTVTVRLGQKELEFCQKVHKELNLTFSEMMLEAIRLFLWIARVIKKGGYLLVVEGEGSVQKQIVVPSLEWLTEKGKLEGGSDG
ncbi:hypothetical protein JW977_02475 [Candidatus Falkowbacteria bacterium]|nr:hypothetical protein [Candidatus Falkowbacteria bacterium]